MFSLIGMNVFPKRSLLYPPLFRFHSTTQQNSFAISYLMDSCGLSQEKAISVSKKIHLESSANPDSVLTLLRNYGFSKSHISKIIGVFPQLLISSLDKTLKPKFDFFNSKGLSGADLIKVLCRDAPILHSNLENTIIPSFDFLKSIVGTDAKVVAVLKRSTTVLMLHHEKMLAPKIALLRTHGVSLFNIAKLLATQPRVFTRSVSRFSEIVEEVKKLEFEPKQYMFLLAVHALSSMNTSSLEAKFDIYSRWWTVDEVQRAFRKCPYCMILSEESIVSKMDYFVNKMGYAPSIVAKQPNVLLYSLEGRIVPRCSVIQVLKTNGQIKKSTTLGSFLAIVEDKFFKKYITRFEKEVPELMNAYQGKGKMELDHRSSVI